MKIKLFFLALFSIAMQAMVVAKPLTIINSTTSPMNVEIFVQSHNQPIKMIVHPGTKQSYNLQDVAFERMVWSTYGKKDKPDAFLLKKYSINVQKKTPEITHGGILVLSLGGDYMYDDKSGRRNAVKFGKGDELNSSTEKGQRNEY